MSTTPYMMSFDDYSGWLMFHLLKRPPRLVGARCRHTKEVGPEGERTVERCRRPVWGDGFVNRAWFGYCSAHWHEYNAFHGEYKTMQANPAAAKLDGTGIRRLTFNDAWDLPDTGLGL